MRTQYPSCVCSVKTVKKHIKCYQFIFQHPYHSVTVFLVSVHSLLATETETSSFRLVQPPLAPHNSGNLRLMADMRLDRNLQIKVLVVHFKKGILWFMNL